MSEEIERAMELVLLEEVPEGAVELGRGWLSWSRYERVGDRYGTVKLFRDDHENVPLTPPEGRGRLLVEVREVRQSGHIGDLFHGIGPGGAVQGEVIVLNPEVGAAYVAEDDDTAGEHAVGVRPDTGRDTLWLSLRALYRAHEQEVTLWWEAA